MAVTLLNSVYADMTVRPWVDHSVWVKSTWDAGWTWVPYLEAVGADEATGPDVGQAQFVYWFGNIKRHDQAAFDVYSPIILQARYVMVVCHDLWGDWACWFGVIQHENDLLHGTTAYLQGKQAFTAFELSHLLDRSEISDAYTDAGWIDRAVGFNEAIGRGYSLEGNRSAAPEEDGYYRFSADGDYWTGAEAIDYLLAGHVRSGITWQLAGEGRIALEGIVEEFAVAGMTVKRALEVLVDRRRGLGWRVVTFPDPGSVVYVYAFSVLGAPIQFGDIYMEANQNQVALLLDGRIDADIEIAFSELERFDTILARGELVRVCGTYSYADGTLEKGWTEAEETDYRQALGEEADNDANDNARQSDALAPVYQKHRVPDAWDGMLGNGEGGPKRNAWPVVTDDGILDFEAAAGVLWMKGKRFLNDLPIEESGGVAGTEPDYRRAFAVVKDGEARWHFVNRIRDPELAPAHLNMADRELAAWVKPAINHRYGLNHFLDTDPGTDFDPVLDYEQLAVTVCFETDARLQARIEVPGQYWRETGRTKTIDVRDAHAWIVMPNTITDIQDGALVRSSAEDYTVARLDAERVQRAAVLAAAWYGMARATAEISLRYLSAECSVGSLLVGAVSAMGAVDIGTVVTRRRWDFRKGTTVVATGFSEMEWAQ